MQVVVLKRCSDQAALGNAVQVARLNRAAGMARYRSPHVPETAANQVE